MTENQKTCVQFLALLEIPCGTFNKSFNLSVPQLLICKMGIIILPLSALLSI